MTLTAIQEAVLELTGITKEELAGTSRKHSLVIARQIYCGLARKLTDRSWVDISQVINKDHATAMYHAKMADIFIQNEKKFRQKYYECLDNLIHQDEMFYTYIDEY
jgi:chromosomal replication initiation ATPase DnaA